MNGNFREAGDSCVVWDDVDEVTFTSFWQYVYTGDYDIPESSTKDVNEPAYETFNDIQHWEPSDSHLEPLSAPESVLQHPPRSPLAVSYASTAIDAETRRIKPKRKSKPSALLLNKQNALWLNFQESWRSVLNFPASLAPQNDQELSTHPTALAHHARVYILADRYAVIRLADVALSKLYLALVRYFHKENTLDVIVSLLQVCLEEPTPERLRDMITHYAACMVEDLWKKEDFQQLLEDHGDFSRALVGMMLHRLD